MKSTIKKFLASKIGRIVEQYLVGFGAIFADQYFTTHNFHASWKAAIAAVVVPAWFKVKDGVKALLAKKIVTIAPVVAVVTPVVK